jgi:hypothetical protein
MDKITNFKIVWIYSFFKNIRLFTRRIKLRYKEKHDLIFYWHDFIDICKFEQTSDWEKDILVRCTKKRELRLMGLSGFVRRNYDDTH